MGEAMKKLVWGAGLVLTLGLLSISSGEVFQGAFKDALAQAKSSGKLLLVDFTQSRG